MFLHGHRGVTEALGNWNPLPLSHSKDCPVFAWRGWGPSSGTGDPPQELHEAVTAWLPPAWVRGQPGHRHAGFSMTPGGTLAPSSLSARERDAAACPCLLRARAALSAREPLACIMTPFPTVQPRGLPSQCCRSQVLHARGAQLGGCVLLPVLLSLAGSTAGRGTEQLGAARPTGITTVAGY